MRLPIAIYPLALVLIISARDGHYAVAGLLSACYIFGNAISTPILAALVDRYGQRRLLLPSGCLHAMSVVALCIMLSAPSPNWVMTVPTAIAGFTYLSVDSLVRSRWANIYADQPELATALSVESVLDEVIFTIGPLIATVLVTRSAHPIVLYLGAALVAGGSLWLAGLRSTEPPSTRHEVRLGSVLGNHGMLRLTITTVAMGATFASAEVSMVAYCGEQGHRSLGGVVIAAMAAGSGIAGFACGAVEWRRDVLARFRLQTVVFAILPVVLLAVMDVAVLALAAFVIGLGIAPVLTTTFSLVQRIVPEHALTEGLAWAATGINVGYGAGAALVGVVADHYDARVAFLVVLASSLPVGALGVWLRVEQTPASAATTRTCG